MGDLAAEAHARAAKLREAAREHKRAANRHKRRARMLMAQLAEFRRECERRGIELQIDTNPEGGTGDRPADSNGT